MSDRKKASVGTSAAPTLPHPVKVTAKNLDRPIKKRRDVVSTTNCNLTPGVGQKKRERAPDHGILCGQHYQILQKNLAGSRDPYTVAEISLSSLRQDTNAFLRTGNPLFALRALATSLQSGDPAPSELVTYFVNSVFFTWDTIHHMINGSEGASSPSKAAELFVDYFAINGGKGRANAFAAVLKEHHIESRKRQETKAIVHAREETFQGVRKAYGKGKIKLAVKDTEDKLGVGRTTIYSAGSERRGRQNGTVIPKGPAGSK